MGDNEHWKTEPDENDYAAAARYLRLLLDDEKAQSIAQHLSEAPILRRRANDLLRASALPLLPSDDPEVAKFIYSD